MSKQMPGMRDEKVMGEGLAVSGKLSAFSLWRRLCGWLAGASSMTLHSAMILVEVIFPDVSFYQKIIDFLKMKLAGAMGVIIRAGQNSWVDSFWYENWTKAKAAGLPRGSYWFYDSRKSPQEQARIWASLVKDDSGEMEHCADFEERYGGQYTGWRHWYDFLVEFQRLTGLPNDRIAIYTGYYYWIEYGPNAITEAASLAWFGRFPLWIAWYTDNPANVKIPKPWTNARHWQKGTPAVGHEFGVQTIDIDMNNSNMSRQEFLAKYSGGEIPDEPLPPEEEEEPTTGGSTVTTYYLTATGNPTKVFSDSAMTKDVNKIPNGTQFTSTVKGALGYYVNGYGWVKFSQVRLEREVKDETPTPPEEEPDIPVENEAVLDIVITDPGSGKKYGGTGIRLPEIP